MTIEDRVAQHKNDVLSILVRDYDMREEQFRGLHELSYDKLVVKSGAETILAIKPAVLAKRFLIESIKMFAAMFDRASPKPDAWSYLGLQICRTEAEVIIENIEARQAIVGDLRANNVNTVDEYKREGRQRDAASALRRRLLDHFGSNHRHGTGHVEPDKQS